jgi:hypothetical protein
MAYVDLGAMRVAAYAKAIRDEIADEARRSLFARSGPGGGARGPMTGARAVGRGT